MAVSTNVQVILGATDNASSVIQGVGSTARKTGESAEESFRKGGIAAAGFLAAVSGLGVAMMNVAGNFEQNRISFEVMLGSAEKGRKALADLSNFAVKTPFELPQLLQASKSLLAYGIEAENLIPTLRNLGDIASGVGMDKLPNLILAFGQVKAATRLTGMELRQFTEAGVPMLQLLVDQANKAGGSWQMVGGGAKKAKVDVGEMNDKLAIANQRLKEATESGKSKESTLMSLRNTVQNYTQKLGEASGAGEKASRVWVKNTVTVAEMKDMISDGAVSFDMVQKALQSATGEGGKFFEMMERQSKTFGGVMSNIKDQVTRTLAEIAGIDIQNGGLIREGSMFAVMKELAENLLDGLNKVTPKLVAFSNWAVQNKIILGLLAGIIGGALVVAMGAFISTFGAGILVLAKFMAVGALVGAGIVFLKDHIELAAGVLAALGVVLYMTVVPAFVLWAQTAWAAAAGVIAATWPIVAMAVAVGALVVGIAFLITHFKDIVKWVQTLIPIITEFASNIANTVITAFTNLGTTIVTFVTSIPTLLSEAFTALMAMFYNLFVVQIPYAVGFAVGAMFKFFTVTIPEAWNSLVAFFTVSLPMFTGMFIMWIIKMVTDSYKAIVHFATVTVPKAFTDMWNALVALVTNIKNDVVALFVGTVHASTDAVNTLPGNIAAAFEKAKSIAVNKAQEIYSGVKGWFDKIIGFFNDIIGKASDALSKSKEAFSVGFKAGAGKQTGGIVPGPIGSPQMVLAHGGEEIKSVGTGSTGGGGGGVQFNVTIGLYAGTETEKRNVAKQLYGALLQVAQSQNKNVQEYMGG
jgi:tape measure domain-containing protein